MTAFAAPVVGRMASWYPPSVFAAGRPLPGCFQEMNAGELSLIGLWILFMTTRRENMPSVITRQPPDGPCHLTVGVISIQRGCSTILVAFELVSARHASPYNVATRSRSLAITAPCNRLSAPETLRHSITVQGNQAYQSITFFRSTNDALAL